MKGLKGVDDRKLAEMSYGKKNGRGKKKKKLTDSQIMKSRARQYVPVKSQMEIIGSIQAELTRYCMERINNQPSREALGHLAAMNLVVTKMVRSVSNPGHGDNYCDGRNYLSIAEECAE